VKAVRLVVALAVFVLAAPLAAEALRTGQPARLGVLAFGPALNQEELSGLRSTGTFWLALKEHGWIEGQNLIVERRFGESGGQLRAGAAELVRLRPDVLYASSAGLARILQNETKTIPIVVGTAGYDLVASGVVASLARPGGNLTGVQIRQDELIPKKVEFLKALVPHLSRFAFLREDVSGSMSTLPGEQAALAARGLGLKVRTVTVHRPDDFTAAFLDMTKRRDQALLVVSTPFSFLHRRTIVDLAAKHRMAAIYDNDGFVEAGGLVSYGVNRRDVSGRGAIFVDKILKGAKPGDLPIEQPTKFELVINLKAARTLELTVPPSLLGRADRVIE
jgi:putative tryptophan/tyrosine transport system substrate-binding protein